MLAAVAMAAAIPFLRRLAGELFGFQPLPVVFWPVLGAMVVG